MKTGKQSCSCLLAGGMTLALFAAQAVLMGATLAHAGGLMATLALSALYALVYGGALAAYIHLEKPEKGTLLFVGGFAALAMLARVSMLDFVTADYVSFLTGWVDIFRRGGFETLAKNVGDYNLLYQYILLLISRSSLHDLYLIKLVTVLFDYALALVMMRAAGRFGGERAKLPVFLTMLILPTTLLGGACWGQCDSVYAFFVVSSLYLLATDRPTRSAVMLAIAFAFKLQTIFFFPVVLLGLLHKKFKLRHALAFFAAYVVTMVPALYAGRSFIDAVSVYANQSMGQYYDRLTYNAPNLYLFFPMLEFASSQEFTWMRYIEGIDGKGLNGYLDPNLFPDLQHAALYACVVLTLIVVIYWLIHWKEITMDMALPFALFFAIFLPFVMPKIHERYFYLADMLSILYASSRRDRRFMPLLVVGASLMSYVPYLMRQRPIDERWLAVMMFAALFIVSRDILTQMRANRAAFAVCAAADAPEADAAFMEEAFSEAVFEEAVFEEAVFEEAVSEEAVSEEAVSEEAVSEEAVSEEAVSEEAVSEEAVFEEAVSEEAVSEESASAEKAAEEIHAETVSGDVPADEDVPAAQDAPDGEEQADEKGGDEA